MAPRKESPDSLRQPLLQQDELQLQQQQGLPQQGTPQQELQPESDASESPGHEIETETHLPHLPHSGLTGLTDREASGLSSGPRALAFASTTACAAKLLVPIGIFATHALFLYGQTANMWRLTASYDVDVHYTAESTQAKLALEALKIDASGHVHVPHTQNDVRVFTYSYAIKELWNMKNVPSLFLPRLAAAGLVLFSGIWPHFKLLMLLLTWLMAENPIRRGRILRSLSILGKWSLVDVLVVCVMVGVLNLQWESTAEAVLNGATNNWELVASLAQTLYDATALCSKALHFSCVKPSKFKHKLQCQTCKTTVKNVYEHPDVAKGIVSGLDMSGGGRASLAVAGLPGIYYFCAAVVLSILLSLVVDWCDYNSNARQQQHMPTESSAAGANTEERTALLSTTATTTTDPEGDITMEEGLTVATGETTAQQQEHQHQLLLQPPKVDIRSAADIALDDRIWHDARKKQHLRLVCAGYIIGAVVVTATAVVTMERRVYGAIPTLLHDILAVVWTKQYSFWGLAWTTGLEGGWDLLLMATFGLFVVMGPIVRSLLCVVASRRPTADLKMSSKFVFWIDFIGAFCAWEVFLMAVFMVDLLMPSITNTIYTDKRCNELEPNETSCFAVEFDMQKTFWMVIIGGVSLLFLSGGVRNAM